MPRASADLSYLQFVAPALAATTAATTAPSESMFPVMGAIKWIRTYFGMLATPLRVGDVLAGHLTVDRHPGGHRGRGLSGRHGCVRGHPVPGGGLRPPGRGADRDGLRRPPGGLLRQSGQRGGLSAGLSPGHHPAVSLLRGVLPDQLSCQPACGSSPTSPRCGTGWTCAGVSRWAGSRREWRPSTSSTWWPLTRGRAVRRLSVVPGPVAHVTSRTLALPCPTARRLRPGSGSHA